MDDGKLDALGQTIVSALGGAASAHAVAFNQLTVTVDAGKIVEVVKYLRDDPALRFVNIIDVTAVDYPSREKRFDVVYHLLSPTLNERIRAARGSRRDHAGALDHRRVSRRRLVRARDLRPLRRDLHRPSRHAPAADRLRFRRPSAAQGLPAHRLRRGALRRPGEAGALRAGPPQPGIPQIRFPLAMGRRGLSRCPGDEKAEPKA